MLDDIKTSDHLSQFVAWRRTKAHAIDALVQEGEDSDAWTAYRDAAMDGEEHRLLSSLRDGINYGQIRRYEAALSRLRKVHARRVRNEFRGRGDLQPLLGYGLVRTLDALILFYNQLARITRSAKPERFANKSSKALERQRLDEFLRIAKHEQGFYGNIAIISHRLGLPGSVHDYAAAHKSYALRRKAGRVMLVGLSGLLAASLGALVTVEAYQPPPHADALDNDIVRYIQDDRIVNHEAETRLERRYGFDIVGPYTPDDLAHLEARLAASYPPEVVRLLGLRRIVLLDAGLKTHVDYAGRAIQSTGEMRLFSGTSGAIFDHEMAHFQTFTHERTQSDFVARWNAVAGPYEHVEYEVGPRERGGVIRDPRYSDGAARHLPRHGYILAYGGVNYHEDISTFVGAVRSDGLAFILVTQDFDIYERKLALLRNYHYISEEEFAKAAGLVALARADRKLQGAPDAGLCIPGLPEAL